MGEHTDDLVDKFVWDDATAYELDELREWAGQLVLAHHPSQQDDNSYDRCALCSYTRHPCDTFDLAAAIWNLTASGSTEEASDG